MNGLGDLAAQVVYMLVFWVVLFGGIEFRILCGCCLSSDSRMKRMTQDDNDKAFKDSMESEREEASGGESSEIAQIFGEKDKLSLRFNVIQKPKEELAYKI